jgi:Rha family phage regulatory protein
VVADSRDVAAFFGKRHDNVVRDIDNLLKELGEGGLLNFEQTPYVDPQNGQTYRRFDMDRDGFTLLAMGFKGKKALDFRPSGGRYSAVRVIVRDGEPWFVLADVCKVLEIANSGNAAARLKENEKDAIRLADTTGRMQSTSIISEAGFYRLVLRSDKPVADVCKVLEISHAPSAAQRLDDDEKATVAINHSSTNPQMTVISESGLYSLVLTSRGSCSPMSARCWR